MQQKRFEFSFGLLPLLYLCSGISCSHKFGTFLLLSNADGDLDLDKNTIFGLETYLASVCGGEDPHGSSTLFDVPKEPQS